MSHEERPAVPIPVPYDADGHLVEVLWSRLSGALWRWRARRALGADDAGGFAETSVVWLSHKELQALLSILRDRARTHPHLIAKFEAALEAAG